MYQTHIPFSISETKAKKCFDLIYCDMWGTYHVKSFGEAIYFLIILDDTSRSGWTYLMQGK